MDEEKLKGEREKEEKKQETVKEDVIPLTYTADPYDTLGISEEAIDDAHKYARYAVSALQFEDTQNAVLNLTTALKCLGVTLPPQH